MSVKLLTEHHLEFQSCKEAAQAHLSLHLSKCHIVAGFPQALEIMGNLENQEKSSMHGKIMEFEKT